MKNGTGKKRKLTREEEIEKVLGRFGQYLSRRRGRRHFSIRGLALRAEMPYSNVHQLEQCKKNPRLTELIQLADAFDETLMKFIEPVVRE